MTNILTEYTKVVGNVILNNFSIVYTVQMLIVLELRSIKNFSCCYGNHLHSGGKSH